MKSVKKENLGIPYMVEGYGYLVDKNLLKDLFALDDAGPLLTDLKTCDYQEFRDFTNAVDDYIRDGSAHTVSLNSHFYKTIGSNTGLAGGMTGVFLESGAEKWTYADHMINIPLNAVFKNYSEASYARPYVIGALKEPGSQGHECLGVQHCSCSRREWTQPSGCFLR